MCIFCEKAQAQLAAEGGLTAAQRREAEQCESLRERRVRATIVTGFLGAGKTTFLNFVLQSWHGKRIGVVQNEFGNVSVDDQLMLVERSQTEVITMPNGCLCCRVRGDMVDALRRLALRPESTEGAAGEGLALDNLIIECSGLSEVIPVAQTFFADPWVQGSFSLDGVVCVCDAGTFESLEGGGVVEGVAGADVAKLLREQLSISDICLLNKCDMVDSSRRDHLSARIKSLNPSIKVVPCRQGKVNLGQVLKLNAFSLEGVLSLDAHFLNGTGAASGHGGGHGGGHGDGHAHSHEAREHTHTAFGSVGIEVHRAIDVEALRAWLRDVVTSHGDKLVRIKGIIRTAVELEAFAVVQGVGGHIELNEGAPKPSGPGPAAGGRLVLIGRLLSGPLEKELREGFDALPGPSDA